MQWTNEFIEGGGMTFLHDQAVGVHLDELETNGHLLAMVNVVPSEVDVIELEASDGHTALRFLGPGYAFELALPMPALRFIALMDGAISHAHR